MCAPPPGGRVKVGTAGAVLDEVKSSFVTSSGCQCRCRSKWQGSRSQALYPAIKMVYQYFFERWFDIFKDFCFPCISTEWETVDL